MPRRTVYGRRTAISFCILPELFGHFSRWPAGFFPAFTGLGTRRRSSIGISGALHGAFDDVERLIGCHREPDHFPGSSDRRWCIARIEGGVVGRLGQQQLVREVLAELLEVRRREGDADLVEVGAGEESLAFVDARPPLGKFESQKNASFAGGLGSTMTFNSRYQERWHSAESAESDLKVCLWLRRAA
jgi:hypothetical protein